MLYCSLYFFVRLLPLSHVIDLRANCFSFGSSLPVMGPPFPSLWRQRIQAFSAQLALLDLQADDDPVGVREKLVAQSHHVRGAKIGRVGGLRRGRRHARRHEQTYRQPGRGTEPRPCLQP